jgi:hypothetical protein
MFFSEKREMKFIKKMISGIPDSPIHLRNTCLNWMHQDTEKNFIENPNINHYGNFTYFINSKGYRYQESGEQSDFVMASFGCSYMFGAGLPQEMICSELLAEKIRKHLNCSVSHFNFAIPGGGNQAIARIASVISKTISPDLIIANFTHPHRREHIDNNGNNIFYYSKKQQNADVFPLKNIIDLTNPCDDLLHLYMSMDHVKNIAKCNNIKYLWSHINDSDMDLCYGWDKESYVGILNYTDRARDSIHPGKLSHQRLFEKYWKKLSKLI